MAVRLVANSYTRLLYLTLLILFYLLAILFGRQEGHPACKKTERSGAGVVIMSGATCRLAYGTADATATHCLLLQ